MAWYEKTQTPAHIARYENTYVAWKEGRAAARRGWQAAATTKGPPRIAVGKTIRNAVLTGGITLLLGKRVQKNGVVTVVYVRSAAADTP